MPWSRRFVAVTRGARQLAGAPGLVLAGNQWVVETDVADCFCSIPHSGLLSAVEEPISDRRRSHCYAHSCASE